MGRMSALQRFMRRVIVSPSGCWELNSKVKNKRYLSFFDGAHAQTASRFIYEKMVGKIPKNKELDHLCRNTRCVNPYHLQSVTHRENLMNGKLGKLGHWNKAKTHCPHGHQYTKENTYIYHETNGGFGRQCRTCGRNRDRNKRSGARVSPCPVT